MQEEQNFYVIEMEVMPDHVHMLLDVDPTVGVKLPTLWTRSKFIATVGSVSIEVVKKYIEEQKSNEQCRKK